MDLRIIEQNLYFVFFRRKVKTVNSIVEPYATHKKSLYGYSNLSVFFCYLASFCEIEEPFLLYHQGNDPSTR